MSGENDGTGAWYAFGKSVIGASHKLKKMPNQDAIYWKSGEGFPLALAIADGHGSEKYFRSGIGAQFAVELAVEEMGLFSRSFSEPISNRPFFEHLAKQLPQLIVEKWQEKVWKDCVVCPLRHCCDETAVVLELQG